MNKLITYAKEREQMRNTGKRTGLNFKENGLTQ